MKTLLREPLVHFVVMGAVLFLVFGLSSGRGGMQVGRAGQTSGRIVVTPGNISQLAAGFERSWKRAPSESELEGLIEDYVRDEVYYREALAMGLDREDAVIRRRLRQKLEFLSEDLEALDPPTDKTLQSFLDEHADEFRVEPLIAFRQVYVDSDRRGGAALEHARRVLADLRAGAPSATLGDPMLLAPELGLSRLTKVAARFGDDFAEALLEVPLGVWQGPVRSSYGLHLVEVIERVAGYSPDLGEVREAVQREWLAARKAEIKEQVYRKFRQHYSITIQRPVAAIPTSR